ncbi:RDD family protein [Mycoplasma marinum]|uniref:RDD domain-containing protein n=1 Tax=Mycoplasma marinum TaxID=1937190 RepID=A0A4V2NHX7_9MOLU|nr:RDD family protein [Mycoplasma marinum]TCG10508.1 hypothetical protein C4B24_04550 [Mycoplasma marinum]
MTNKTKHNIRHVYTKSGRLVEFPIYSKIYSFYILLRSLAFATDFLMVLILQTIVYKILGGGIGNFFLSSTIAFVYLLIYNSFTMIITDGQTLGMKIAKVKAVHASGFSTSKQIILIRAAIGAVYALPVVGWAMVIANIFSALFFKGFTMVDYCSRTVVVTIKTFKNLSIIEDEFYGKGVK